MVDDLFKYLDIDKSVTGWRILSMETVHPLHL